MNFTREQKWLGLVFVLTTFIFVLQHVNQGSWDFHAYVLNSEYWFHRGSYFEPFRPPLTAFVVGLLGLILPRLAAEYAFIVLVSLLFGYGTVRFARAAKLNPVWFYLISSNAYLLLVGLVDGSELLTFALLELFVASLIENRDSGGYLGLMSLARYTGFSFVPLLLAHGKVKKIAKNVVFFVLPLVPWFIYNFVKWGNWFTSIADQYANNIYFRDYMWGPMQLSHFVRVANVQSVFALVGFGVVVYELFKHRRQLRKERANLLVLAVAVLSVYTYGLAPLKLHRYLFNLLLPISYFAYKGVVQVVTWCERLRIDQKKWVTIFVLVIFALGYVVALSDASIVKFDRARYLRGIADLKAKEGCAVSSNAWVELTYYGFAAGDFPRRELLNRSLERGEIVVLFKYIGEPQYADDEVFLHEFAVVKQTSEYIILGKGCVKRMPLDELFVKKVADRVELLKGERTEERACHLLFKREWMAKLCDSINKR